jgi:hypothetical protein
MRIGLDLDNTIIYYDDAFVTAARGRGLVPAGFSGTKQQVRDHIRSLPEGEISWQKLQGHVYGAGIAQAAIFPGASDCIKKARAGGHQLFIVSHKTEFGHYDDSKTNLREAALFLLEAHGFFDSLGFSKNDISFHATRREKVDTIHSLSLDWFVDDLVEVYEEENFPAHTQKILFYTSAAPAPSGDWQVCNDWDTITKTLFA